MERTPRLVEMAGNFSWRAQSATVMFSGKSERAWPEKNGFKCPQMTQVGFRLGRHLRGGLGESAGLSADGSPSASVRLGPEADVAEGEDILKVKRDKNTGRPHVVLFVAYLAFGLLRPKGR